ncbi:MAG: hypothetical protein J6S30_04545 [Kiritimatiellae bacterium]|nr:hypothetical protein [Kiritimatiellia bacterium]
MKIASFLKKHTAHVAFYICALFVFAPIHAAFSDYTVDSSGRAEVSTLEDLLDALDNPSVSKVVVKNTITLEDGTYLSANSLTTGSRKIVQVEDPFLPDNGKVTLKANNDGVYNEILTPASGEYSTYNLFDIHDGARVTISNLTLYGGFEGSRTVNGDAATTGGIDNDGLLTMYDTDILRTGTALLNRPGATAVLVGCNIVRNANWYGGGILNFAEAINSGGETVYRNGGTVIMDRCSLTENESLGPSHGGGAAENQGIMCLNNCVVANNASTEIGGGINNCKGGDLYVLNSTFTGNITTSDDYGITAGGAIGNAGGAGNVYIANSILAHNGYDTGDFVNNVSLGRYEGSSTEHYCHLANTAIDATAGMDRVDSTNLTVKVDGLFAEYREDGIVAAGGDPGENGVNTSSPFTHPHVPPLSPEENPYAYVPVMTSVETNHYVFTLAVDTYFDYSSLLNGGKDIYMGYLVGDEIVALGGEQGDMKEPTEAMLVTVTFNGDSRLPDEDGFQRNIMGAATVEPLKNPQAPSKPGVFLVKLGTFTGGQVSGVTIYGDSYISNSLVTVHAQPESAHYLNGWDINGTIEPESAQKLVFSFLVTTNITLTPIFQPVITQIYRARQRYPWNNLVDIDYSVAETNAVKYRLVFLATYEEDGVTNTIQLKTFRKNADVSQIQRLGDRHDLHRAGDHRVTWDSAADGVELKGKKVYYRALACEGEER